jgi:gamma-glutamylcysteine synthetase
VAKAVLARYLCSGPIRVLCYALHLTLCTDLAQASYAYSVTQMTDLTDLILRRAVATATLLGARTIVVSCICLLALSCCLSLRAGRGYASHNYSKACSVSELVSI